MGDKKERKEGVEEKGGEEPDLPHPDQLCLPVSGSLPRQPPKCYCHYCNTEEDIRYVMAGKGILSTTGVGGLAWLPRG